MNKVEIVKFRTLGLLWWKQRQVLVRVTKNGRQHDHWLVADDTLESHG